MEKVSVIIPTFNRFSFLLHAIHSIKQQTYHDVEIIVINDCSTEKEYYEYPWTEHNITMIHLKKNTKTIFEFGCAAYVRNKGIEIAKGKYIAFCDDDDIWFPRKLEMQLNAMKSTGCKMSCTDGLIGCGVYVPNQHYYKYNAEHYYSTLLGIYRGVGSTLLDNGFPKIWNLDFLKIHNCMVCSSVVVEYDVLDKIHNFHHMKPPGEDYDCWLRVLEHTDCVYIDEVGFYYDNDHGHGQQY